MKFCYSYFRFVAPVLLCIGLGVSVSAQRKAPGYMGKRFLLKYDQGFSWSFGGDARGIPNFFYTLQGDLAVTTKWSVGAEYSFMTRKYDKIISANNYYYDDYPNLSYRLGRTYMHRIGIYGKLFSQRNGHIAPAGPYFLMGLNVHLVQGTYRYNTYSSVQQKRLTFDFAPTFGGGKQYVIANRMVMSVDLRISVPLIGLARTINNETGIGNEYGKGGYASLDRGILWPNTQANFIELRIGLGTLL